MNRFQNAFQVMQQAQLQEAKSEHDTWLEEQFNFVALPEGEEIPRLVFV